MAITNILFIFVGKGDVELVIVIAGLNGLPFGAKFLADAILADIIDYDEFLTGQRNEATYTMFKSFLPKICAIPAAAIPLSLLETFGHVAPVDGRVQKQDGSVYNFCVIVTVVLPTCLSLVAYAAKRKFPLKTKAQVDKISEGVALHMIDRAAPDPITGEPYTVLHLNEEQERYMHLLEAFRGVKFIKSLIDSGAVDGANKTLVLMRQKRCYAFVILAGSAVLVGSTLTLIFDKSVSFIPVMAVITMGISVCNMGFCHLRVKLASQLYDLASSTDEHVHFNTDLMRRVLTNRMNLQRIFKKLHTGDTDILRQQYDQMQRNGPHENSSELTPSSDSTSI